MWRSVFPMFVDIRLKYGMRAFLVCVQCRFFAKKTYLINIEMHEHSTDTGWCIANAKFAQLPVIQTLVNSTLKSILYFKRRATPIGKCLAETWDLSFFLLY